MVSARRDIVMRYMPVLPLLLSCVEAPVITDPHLIRVERFIGHCAANEMPQVMKMIQQGIAINSQNFQFGSTCLHHAAYAGRFAMVQYLLDQGASVEIQDKNGRTPLFDAIYVPRNYKPETWDKKVVTLLLQRGAKKTINTPAHGGTPLYWACRLHEPEIVRILLENGADPNYGDDKDWSESCVKARPGQYREESQLKNAEIRSLMKKYGAKPVS